MKNQAAKIYYGHGMSYFPITRETRNFLKLYLFTPAIIVIASPNMGIQLAAAIIAHPYLCSKTWLFS